MVSNVTHTLGFFYHLWQDIYVCRKQLLYSGMDWTTVEAGKSLDDEDDFL